MTPQAVKVLMAVTAPGRRPLEFVEFDWSAEKYLREGISLPRGAVEMLRDEFDAILFGALGDPRVPSNQHAADILLGLRFKLDLYVNARPVELLLDRLTPLRDRTEKDIRFMVFRENTEGLYVGVGGFFKKGTPDEIAVQEDVNSRKGVERIIRYAFQYARQNGLKRVCMSDKSNAMNFAHDLWQRVFKEVRKEYSDIDSRHLYIDTLAMVCSETLSATWGHSLRAAWGWHHLETYTRARRHSLSRYTARRQVSRERESRTPWVPSLLRR